MLLAIKSFFTEHISTDTIGEKEHALRLATAALMIEMMQQDDKVHEAEIETVKRSLQERFQLDDTEAQKLFELASNEAKHATDYYQFTTLINNAYTPEQKYQVVEYLWEIAYADQHLDRYEEHMVRRIAELIYLPHSEFIRAKHTVQARLKM